MIIGNPYELFPVVAAVSKTAIYVVSSVTGDVADDQQEEDIRAILEGDGWTVDVAQDNVVVNADLAGYDIVIVSSDAAGFAINSELYTEAIPMLLFNYGLTDNYDYSVEAGDRTATSSQQIAITDNTHPVTTGISTGLQDILTSASRTGHTGATLGAGASTLAVTHEHDGSTVIQPAIVVYESGANMANSGTAPAKRCFLTIQGPMGSDLNATGESILVNAANWLNT